MKLPKKVALPRCLCCYWKNGACCSLKMAVLEEPASWAWLGWAVCWFPQEAEVRVGLKSRCFWWRLATCAGSSSLLLQVAVWWRS